MHGKREGDKSECIILIRMMHTQKKKTSVAGGPNLKLILATVTDFFKKSLAHKFKNKNCHADVSSQIWLKHPSWFCWRGLLLSSSQEHIPMAKLETSKCKCRMQTREGLSRNRLQGSLGARAPPELGH